MMKNIPFKKWTQRSVCSFFIILIGFYLPAQDDFVTIWKTDNPGTSNSTSISIPLNPNKEYSFDVDWNNDGTFDEFGITQSVVHDFGTVGTYTIRIRGEFPSIYFNGDGDKDKILDVVQWGNNVWGGMNSAFKGCSNLNFSATDVPDLSEVSSLVATFFDCTAFNSNINHWDVSNISSFYFTFGNCIAFNQPLNEWNMSKATKLQRMFIGCTSFNQNINDWDVSQVPDFASMFFGCSSFNQPLSKWDTSKGVYMGAMFGKASNFNQDIGNWDVSSARTIGGMFNQAFVFNQDISNWDVSNVNSLANTFANAQAFDQDISNWKVDNVTNMARTFLGAISFNHDISNWNTSNVTNMVAMFQAAEKFNQDISGWEVSQVTNMSNMFNRAIAFNQDIGNWDVRKVVNMNTMFHQAEEFDQDLSHWDVSNVANFKNMFSQMELSVTNYDNLLIGWSNLSLKDSMNFNGGNSTYCNGGAAREKLVATFNWSVQDKGANKTAPIIICKDISTELSVDGSTTISPEMLDDGSFGYCTPIHLTASQTVFNCDDVGEQLVTLTAIDELGNESSCETMVMVLESSTAILCPSNINATARTENCSAHVYWTNPIAGCDVTYSSSHISGDLFPMGKTMVTYTASDVHGVISSCNFEVSVVSDLAINIDQVEAPLCYGASDGQVLVSVDGGFGSYSYDWDIDGVGDVDDLEDQEDLTAGIYAITVSDDAGCTESTSVEINDPAPLQLTAVIDQAGTPASVSLIDLTVSGGTAPYQYDWDFNGLGIFNDPEDFYPSESGVYTVFVEDANGCMNSLAVEVLVTSIHDVCQVEYIQIFPSLNDGNFTLAYGECSDKKQLEIFERSGKLVFKETTMDNRLAIDISNELPGTYYLRISTDREVVMKPFVIAKN